MTTKWPVVALGEVCDFATGGTPDTKIPEYHQNGNIPWLVSGDVHKGEIFECDGRITELGMKHSNARLLTPNSVLIALAGQGKTRGTVALLRISASCNQSVVAMTPKDPRSLLPEYLSWNLRARYTEIRRMSGDDDKDRRGLNMRMIRSIVIPLPPLDEQKRIVAKLDAAMNLASTLRKNSVLLQNRTSDLTAAFLRNRLHSNGSTLTAPLKDVAELKGRIGWRGLTAKEYTKAGPYFLSVHSLNFGKYVDFKQAFHISQERYDESPEIMIRQNDLLICKDGAGIGKLGMVGKLPGQTTINSSLLLIRTNELVKPDYLYYYLLSPIFQEIVQTRLSGSTTPHLYQRDIAELKVALPSIEEQVSCVNDIEHFIGHNSQISKIHFEKDVHLRDFRAALFAEAFAGEL